MEAWAIAHRFAEEAQTILAHDLVAVVVVGSLAAGNYIPGRSDIDIIVVTRDECPDEPITAIAHMAARYWKQYGFRKGFGGYGIRLRDLQPPYGILHDEVYEILQLKRRGQVISGYLNLSQIPEPSSEDLRRSLADLVPDLVGAWERSYPAPIDSTDAQVNTILYWMRLFVWDRTGEYVLDKHGALTAFSGLGEAASIHRRLAPIVAYVHRAQERPGPVDELCHEVESFVLTHVEWARQAAENRRANQ